MSTVIRPELSDKNKYWIDRHRYYELKHFCMQYDIWKQAYNSLDSLVKMNYERVPVKSSNIADPVERSATARSYYFEKIAMIEKAANETDSFFAEYILKAVTEGLSYEKLLAQTGIPCCKDKYYDLYRRFFWILNRIRN